MSAEQILFYVILLIALGGLVIGVIKIFGLKKGGRMKKKILALALVVSLFALSGCGFFKRTYLYEPSVIQRSTATDEAGKTTIKVTDAIIMAYVDAAIGAWTRRSQITSGINMGLQAEGGFLAVLPMIADAIGIVIPVAGLVSIGNTVIGKFADMVNPQTRTAAFDQAIEMGNTTRDIYFRSLKAELKDKYTGEVPSDKATDAGRVLWAEVDTIIGKVNDALAQRISKAAPVVGSGENVVRGAVFIGPSPTPVTPGQ